MSQPADLRLCRPDSSRTKPLLLLLLGTNLPSAIPLPPAEPPVPNQTAASGPDALNPLSVFTSTLFPFSLYKNGEPKDQLRHHGKPPDRRIRTHHLLQHRTGEPDPNPAGRSRGTRTRADGKESEHQWTFTPSSSSSKL